MQFTDQQTLPVPLAAAWTALNDLDLLRDALPGCTSLVETAAGEFRATLALPVGPFTAHVDARLHRHDLAPAARGRGARAFVIRFDADTLGGSGEGEAGVRLRSAGRGATTLHYELDLRLAGPVAVLGGTMVDAAAARVSGLFFERLRDGLVARQDAA